MAANLVANEGSVVRFYTSATPYPGAAVGAFTSLSGVAVDPDVVTFGYVLENEAPVTFTYTNPGGDPTSTIVRTGVGEYQADIDTTGLVGNWIWRWAGYPVSGGADTTKTAIATEGSITVLANDLIA
jgi:hypothetical protein